MLSHSTKNQTKENKTKQQTAISFFFKVALFLQHEAYYKQSHTFSSKGHECQSVCSASSTKFFYSNQMLHFTSQTIIKTT